MLVSPSSGSLPAAVGSTQSHRTWTALAQSSSSRLKHSMSVAEDFCSKERTRPSEWGSVTWSSSFSPEWSLILFSRPAGLLQLHCSTLTGGPCPSPVLPVELLRKYSPKDNKIMATDLRKLYFLKSTQHFLSLSKSFQAKKQKHTKEQQTWGTQRNKNGFLLSLSFLSTSFKCLSISLPLFLSSSHSLSEEVTVQGRGAGYDSSILLPPSDHRAEHMLHLHPLAAARRLMTKTKKNPTATQTLDQLRSSLWSLQNLWHQHFILNWGQIHGIISISRFTRSRLRVKQQLWSSTHGK